MEPEALRDEVMAAIVRLTRCPPDRVTIDADLVEDLGIAGDDGPELVAALAVAFGFRWAPEDVVETFGPEGLGIGLRLIRAVWTAAPPRRRVHRPLRVRDLVAAAETGALIVPPPETQPWP